MRRCRSLAAAAVLATIALPGHAQAGSDRPVTSVQVTAVGGGFDDDSLKASLCERLELIGHPFFEALCTSATTGTEMCLMLKDETGQYPDPVIATICTTYYQVCNLIGGCPPLLPATADEALDDATGGLGGACRLASASDPTAEGGIQTGLVSGISTGDLDRPAATVTLRCSVQIGAANDTHDGADAVVLSGTGIGLATLTGPVSYVSPADQPVHLCTQLSFDGKTYYRDATAGAWSADPAVACDQAIRLEVPLGPPGALDDVAENALVDTLEPAICPAVAGTGVPALHDCPPHGL